MCNSLQPTHKPYVKIALVGDIVETDDAGFTLEAVNHSFDGETEYRDQIPVVLSEQNGKLKKGDKVEIFGTLAQFSKRTKVFAMAADVKKVAKTTPYENVAAAVGRMAVKETFDAIPGKRAWGYMLLEVAEGLLARGVFFRNNLVNFIARKAPEDSIMKIVGALRNREYPNSAGETDRMLEITALPRLTYKGKRQEDAGIKILSLPETVNAFAAYSAIEPPADSAPQQDAKPKEQSIPF